MATITIANPQWTTRPGPNPASRVVRGSSWVEGPETARSASREGVGPDWRDNEIGFRVAPVRFRIRKCEYAKRAKPEDAKKAEKRHR